LGIRWGLAIIYSSALKAYFWKIEQSAAFATLETARGQHCLRRKRYEDAAPIFKGVFEKYPRSAYAPESLYYRGVSRYMATHNVDELKEDWIMLQRFHPSDTWAIESNIM
jgi:outer membrane protein assembly factor BamD (BamD/ComL family)